MVMQIKLIVVVVVVVVVEGVFPSLPRILCLTAQVTVIRRSVRA